MKKIAFVSGFFSNEQNSTWLPNQKKMYECLYSSAKKYFLPKQEVDFIFITNCECEIDGVENIKIDYRTHSYHHILLMKILMVDFLKKDYDYVYVNDGDQIYIDYIEENFIDDDFSIMGHFFNANAQSVLDELTDIIKIEGNLKNKIWSMGNFFGGKHQIFKQLVKFAKDIHETNFGKTTKDLDFYARYPDEVILVKFFNEKEFQYKQLSSITVPGNSDEKYFLSDFQDDYSFYPNINNSKVLHNTKKNYEVLFNVIKYYQ